MTKKKSPCFRVPDLDTNTDPVRTREPATMQVSSGMGGKTEITGVVSDDRKIEPWMLRERGDSTPGTAKSAYPYETSTGFGENKPELVESQMKAEADGEQEGPQLKSDLIWDESHLRVLVKATSESTRHDADEIWEHVMAFNEIKSHKKLHETVHPRKAYFAKTYLAPRNITFEHMPEVPLPRFPTPIIAADRGLCRELANRFFIDRLRGYRGESRDNLLNFILPHGMINVKAGEKPMYIQSYNQDLKWVRVIADKLIIKTGHYAVRIPPVTRPILRRPKAPGSMVVIPTSSETRSECRVVASNTKDAKHAASFPNSSSDSGAFTPDSSSDSDTESEATLKLPFPTSSLDAAWHVNVDALDPKLVKRLFLFTPVSKHNSTSPYLTVTFDDRSGIATPGSDTLILNKLAVHSSVALFNRFQLRKKSLEKEKDANTSVSDLQHFGISVDNQDFFSIFVFKPVCGNDEEWNGCVGTRYFCGSLADQSDLTALANFIAYVQGTFLDLHIEGIVGDLKRLKSTPS